MRAYKRFPVLCGLIFGMLILLAWVYRPIMDKLDASHGENLCKDDSLSCLGREKRQKPETAEDEIRRYKSEALKKLKLEKENA